MVLEDGDSIAFSCHRGVIKEELSNAEISSSAIEATQKTLAEMDEKSPFFENNPGRELPVFRTKELQLGLNLGKGEFGVVREILGINDVSGTFGAAVKTGPQNEPIIDADKQRVLFQSLTRKNSSNTPVNEESVLPLNDEQDTRTFMSKQCFRGGKPRYAVKQVRDDLDSETYFIAAVDLAAEAKFLASIEHSNIVRLRATVDAPGSQNFMIVLDRLWMMAEKIVEWRKRERKCRGPFRMMIFRKEMHMFLMVERLVALFDIARALKYLHENKILYRDLKPDNIGCDVRGDYRLFDFGLAKELKQEDLVQAPDSYNCTGLTGSRRWMAPENCLCRQYGLAVDVYSFGLLFWNVMALETPFPGFSLEQHKKRVVHQAERPNIRKVNVAPSLRDMMVRAWSPNPSKRPDFKEICELIQLDICTVKLSKRGSNNINDRSGHLLDQSLMSWFGGSGD